MAEAHAGFRRLRARLPGPFGVTIPVADAVRGLLRGIERRDERILVPPSLLAFLPLRWLVARLGSRTGAGQAIEELSEEMIREYGGAAAVPTSEPPRG